MLAGAAYDRLFALAHRILRDVDRSDDAVQECLVQAWRDIRGLRDTDRFDAWLQRLLVNACYDEGRRRRSRSREIQLLPLDRAAPGDAANDLADRDQLERGFRRLPIEQRAVLVMHHYLDLRLPATVWGGFSASDGGLATAAHLSPVFGVAVDPTGAIYLSSGDGGPASAATLKLPGGVVLDTTGSLYIADLSTSGVGSRHRRGHQHHRRNRDLRHLG